MKVRGISEVYQYKANDTAVLLGSGGSINNISNDEWDAIKKTDIWTMNNWIYHPFIIPDFYHLELKSYSFPFFKKRMQEKRKLYKNVKFIIPTREVKIKRKDGTKHRVPLQKAIGDHPYIFRYRQLRKRGKPKQVGNANYKMKDVLTKSYDTTISIIIELLYKFAYKTVYLYGVDLSDSYYFWTGGDIKYGDVHHQTNKSHEGKDPKAHHATAHIKSFLVDFSNRWMTPENNRAMYLGYKETLLWPDMEYRSII